jgi:hypothetical protein
MDRNKCLWASWAVFTTNGSFFFGGDTGYCSMFKRVGQLFPNGISLAALPIGAYGSDGEKWFHRPNHLDPAEAVQTHLDLNAMTSLGVHWGTFLVTGEPIMEPPELLDIAKKVIYFICMHFVFLMVLINRPKGLTIIDLLCYNTGKREIFLLVLLITLNSNNLIPFGYYIVLDDMGYRSHIVDVDCTHLFAKDTEKAKQ